MNPQLGNVYAALNAGDRAEARRLLERELQYTPSNGELWYLLGQAADDPAQRADAFGRAQALGYIPPQPNYAQPQPGYAPRPGNVADNWVLPASGQPPRRAWWPFVLIILIILGGAGYFYYKIQRDKTPPPTGGLVITPPAVPTNRTVSGSGPIDVVGEQLPDEGNEHVAMGTEVEYDSIPPASGSHWGQWAEWGDQGESTVPDEMLVHNMEHGGVIIAYNPKLVSDAERKQLSDLIPELSAINKRVILVQRSDIEQPVALTAWTYRLMLDTVDLEAIRGFYDAHIARGPECVDGQCP
jgi:hypothetical protein